MYLTIKTNEHERRRREMSAITPFTCGTQYIDWCASNCDRCIKYDPNKQPTCEIDAALAEAYLGDGTVSEDIARRMGYKCAEGELPPYNWPCGEVVWTEEWKAEWNRRQEEKEQRNLPEAHNG